MRYPGGRGISIAMTLATMGAEALATGFFDEHTGRFFQEKLQSKGVTTNFVFIEDDTRHNYYIYDPVRNTRTLIDSEGGKVTPQERDLFFENFRRILSRGKVMVIAGSLPPGLNQDIFPKLITMAKEQGILTLFNSSEENMIEALTADPYLIMPDLRTADEIMGIPLGRIESRLQGACALLKKGVKMAVIGFDRVNYLVVTPEKCLEARSPLQEVKSCLRAGDAMLAGIALELDRGGSLEDCIRRGVAASTASSLKVTGIIEDAESVEKLLKDIEIKEVSQ